MYALILPASTPFVLLVTVLGLSWWEDHILPSPSAQPFDTPAEAAFTPASPAQLTELPSVNIPLTREVAGR